MILILGVTASGKGRLAFKLASEIGGEIISVDSMKVYRRMDIGTAKPPRERRIQIPHHIVDVVEPHESFSVDRFLELQDQAVRDIRAAGKHVVAVGGTAMYIKAMLYGLFEGPGTDEDIRNQLIDEIASQGLPDLHERLKKVDPDAAERIHPNDQKRIIRALEVYELTGRPISAFQQQWNGKAQSDWTVIGLRRDKEDAGRRINARVKKMISDGLVEEVRSLLEEEQPLSQQARCAIGYAEMINHLKGKISLDDAIEQIKINTRRLAKSQRTWFKTFHDVNWIDLGPNDSVEEVLSRTIRICERAKMEKRENQG